MWLVGLTGVNIKMIRKAMIITISELQDLIVNLSQQLTDLKVIEESGYGDIKFQINIVNPKPKCSDTWRLEESYLIESSEKTGDTNK